MKLFALVITCLITAALGAAGSVGAATIRGRVTAADTQGPLAYVSVVLNGQTPQGGIIRTGRATDEEGGFLFTDLPKGSYRVKFLYIGYKEHEERVTLRSEGDVTLTVVLTVEPIELEEIIVEADRFKTEREIQTGFVNIDVQTITQTPGIIEADPLRTLQLLPGVQAASDISSGLYIRGGGPDQTLVLLDNVPVYNPTHALGFFSTFNAGAIGDVALYKGAYPAEHGGRLGAVLEVASRNPTQPDLSGEAGASTIAARATVEGPLGKNHWLVSARRTYLDPLLSALRTEENPIPSYYFYDLNAKFITERGDDWWVFSSYRGRDKVGFDLGEDGDFDISWGNTILSASYNRLLNQSLLAELQLSGNEYEGVTDGDIFGTSFAFQNRLREAALRGDIDWTGPDRHRVRGGLQASLYDFDYAQEFNRESSFAYGTNPYEISAYVDDQWKPWTGTALRVGLRSRYMSDGSRFMVEPRFSASQAVTGEVRVKAGAGIYNQYVQLVGTEGFSFADFYVPIDETALPGRSWHAVLGAEWDAVGPYRVSVEGYYTGLENLVQLDNSVPGDQESVASEDIFNTGGTGYATGVELFAERRLGDLTGWIGYTLGWTRRTFDEVNGGEEFPPKYDRRHDLNVVANYKRGNWTWGGVFVYATGQAFTPASARYGLRDPATGIVPKGVRVLPGEKNSARLLPYHRLDVSVARGFELFGYDAKGVVQIFNLYSRRNEWFVEFGEEDGRVKVDVVKQLPIIPSVGVNIEF